jgi:DNA-binding LacI/PurR family transcriptional regulator
VPSVSRVLNESAHVSPAVASRVREAAQRLGVKLKPPGKRRAIAFLLANRAITHPFHSHVMLGAEAYCAERDYHVVFLTVHYPLRGPVAHLPTPRLLDRKGFVDGFIVAGVNSAALIDLVVATGLPCSALASTLDEDTVPRGCSTVSVDDAAGSIDATRHLIELGHRSICWIGNIARPWFLHRADGYRAAMQAEGLEPRVVSIEAEDEQQVGYLGTKSALSTAARPTAIVAGNDRVAHGVYDALRDHRIPVGTEISVVGFNDTLEAVLLHPALSTVRVFAEQIGQKLAEQTVSRIENPSVNVEQLIMPTRLIRRDSCSSAPPQRV